MRLIEGEPRYVSAQFKCEENCEESATYQCSAYSAVKHLCVQHSVDFFKPHIIMIDHAMQSHFPDVADVEVRKIEITIKT